MHPLLLFTLILFHAFTPFWVELVLLWYGFRISYKTHLAAIVVFAVYYSGRVYFGFSPLDMPLGLFWIGLARNSIHFFTQLTFIAWYAKNSNSDATALLKPFQISLLDLMLIMSATAFALALPERFGEYFCFHGLLLTIVLLRRRGICMRWKGTIACVLVALATMLVIHLGWLATPFSVVWVPLCWLILGGLVLLLDRGLKRQQLSPEKPLDVADGNPMTQSG